MNLEFSVAVTQNYVSTSNLASVLDFMDRSPKHVSGLPHEKRPHLRRRFLDELKSRRPEVFAAHQAKEAAAREACETRRKRAGGGLLVGSWRGFTAGAGSGGTAAGGAGSARPAKKTKRHEEGRAPSFRFSFF